nr:T-cell receptor alpha [Paralichthys olivaceus]
MLSLHLGHFSLLLLSILTGVSCDELTPDKTEEFSGEGSTVTLSYKFSRTVTSNDYFFWYRQYPGKPPEFLLYISGSNTTRKSDSLKSETRFSTRLSGDNVRLQISSAAVTDSAVYYCAVKPVNTGGYKIVFGSGTRVIIEPRDEYEPSYYELEDQDTTITACLATGFSKHNATLEHDLFKNGSTNMTGAARASEESLYSQVALWSDASQCESRTGKNESEVCADVLKKDPAVNTVSLLVVALRLLFLKTVVFNVLLTLRLWLSHRV